MRSAVWALRWREDSAKGGGLLGPPSSHDTEAEEACFMGTAPRLNSTILLAGAFLPLLLHQSRQCNQRRLTDTMCLRSNAFPPAPATLRPCSERQPIVLPLASDG